MNISVFSRLQNCPTDCQQRVLQSRWQTATFNTLNAVLGGRPHNNMNYIISKGQYSRHYWPAYNPKYGAFIPGTIWPFFFKLGLLTLNHWNCNMLCIEWASATLSNPKQTKKF